MSTSSTLPSNALCDGFTLNPFTILAPYRYFAGALAQMEILRRAATYRSRWYAAPDDYNQPLQPYETFEMQVKVSAGSYLWGMRFISYDENWAQVSPANVVVQVTDVCTGIPLFREFAPTGGFSFYTASGQQRGISIPHLMSQPRLFLEPGDVNVEMCNLGSTEQRCQLLLHFAEPCELVEEDR